MSDYLEKELQKSFFELVFCNLAVLAILMLVACSRLDDLPEMLETWHLRETYLLIETCILIETWPLGETWSWFSSILVVMLYASVIVSPFYMIKIAYRIKNLLRDNWKIEYVEGYKKHVDRPPPIYWIIYVELVVILSLYLIYIILFALLIDSMIKHYMNLTCII